MREYVDIPEGFVLYLPIGNYTYYGPMRKYKDFFGTGSRKMTVPNYLTNLETGDQVPFKWTTESAEKKKDAPAKVEEPAENPAKDSGEVNEPVKNEPAPDNGTASRAKDKKKDPEAGKGS